MSTTVNPIPQSVRYRDEIAGAAAAHHVDPLLLAAVAAQETGGPGADSGSNIRGSDGTGRGLFQIDSGSHAAWLKTHHDGMNIRENADYAAQLLGDDLRRVHDDVREALHLYNAGTLKRATSVTRWPDKTMDYAGSVLRHYARLRAK